MAVVINSAVSEASRMNQFHIFCKLTAHQRLYVRALETGLFDVKRRTCNKM